MKRTADSSPKNKRPTSQKKFNKQDNFGIHRPIKGIKPELKWKDTSYTAAVPPFGTWTPPQLLNGLQIGGSGSQRVGRKVNFTKLLVRAHFSAAQAIPPESDTRIRILVLYDKQPNGATPTVTTILNTDDFNAVMLLDTRDRFVIIADEEVPQSVGKNNFTGNIVFNRKFNCETIFNVNGNGDVTDMTTGAFWIMWCGADQNFATGIASQVRSRLRFVDF